MCNFFSCCSNGRGKLFYFDAHERVLLRENNPKNYCPDSHSSIADFHGYPGALEDTLNKYEFNPFTQEFIIDQINTKDDSIQVERRLLKLDFKTVVPELVVKPIINPLFIERSGDVTEAELALLKEWASVMASVGASVWSSVGASVMASVGDSVWSSVGASVWSSVGASVKSSVVASVGSSVGASVWDSVWAYMSSFFYLNQWKINGKRKKTNPFQCCIDLWEAGLVPSFNGKTWRLHAGPNVKTVWEGKL